MSLEALRSDPVRTRAALVGLATAMAIVVCLTTLVERGRAATIRSLERAGLKNLYLVARPSGRPGEPATPLLTTADAEKLRALVPARAVVSFRMKAPRGQPGERPWPRPSMPWPDRSETSSA